MPYEIRPQDGQFLVVDDSGKTVGTHPTRKQALEQQRALYANVQDTETKELSLQEFQDRVFRAFNEQFPTPDYGIAPSTTTQWIIETYPDHVIVSKGNDFYKVLFLTNTQGAIEFQDSAQWVKVDKIQAWIEKAARLKMVHGYHGIEFPKEITDRINAAIDNGDKEKMKAGVDEGITWVKSQESIKEAKPSLIDRVLGMLKEGRRNSTPGEKRLQQIHDLAVENGAQCTFSVKEVGGAYRWVMVSSNSYQDRDKEIIAQAALEADVARSDKERNYGPLRWWHVGDPDPITRAPGAGIDIGTCDFRAMQGRMLIESGTFKEKRIGAAFEKRADDLAASIGFFRPINQPDSEGVYHDIHVFERSVLPRSKASNPLTALTVTKEQDDMATMKEKYDEFVALLGGDTQLAQSVVTAAERTDKAAREAGITSKETDKPAEGVTEKASKKAKIKRRGKGSKGSGQVRGNEQNAAMFARLEESGERTSEKAVQEAAQEPDGDESGVDESGVDESEVEVEAEDIFAALKDDIAALIDEKIAAALGNAAKERTEKETGLAAQITALDKSLKEAQKALNVLGGDLPRGVKNAYRASQADATIDPNKPTIETAKEANPIGAVFNWLVQPVPPSQ